MACTSFEDRLQRIGAKNTARVHVGSNWQTATLAHPGVTHARVGGASKHFGALIKGATAGVLLAVLLKGLTLSGSPWGPGTTLFYFVGFAAMFGFALAPLLVLQSLVQHKRRPGFLTFAAAYFLTVIAVPLI